MGGADSSLQFFKFVVLSVAAPGGGGLAPPCCAIITKITKKLSYNYENSFTN